MILITAFATGLIHFVFFPYSRLLGASGVVFALILLSSFTGLIEGEFPITLVLLAFIYLGQQVVEGLFVYNNVSNLRHIIGGVIGSYLGYVINRAKLKAY